MYRVFCTELTSQVCSELINMTKADFEHVAGLPRPGPLGRSVHRLLHEELEGQACLILSPTMGILLLRHCIKQ
jgi:hypothetical protein